jgi:hypothetical protein
VREREGEGETEDEEGRLTAEVTETREALAVVRTLPGVVDCDPERARDLKEGEGIGSRIKPPPSPRPLRFIVFSA